MNPFTLFICVVVSLLLSIVLFFFAPAFLLVYGPLLAYGGISVLVAWMAIEYLDELHHREQEAKARAEAILNDTALYRVHWVSTATGHEGWGTDSFPLALVKQWCEEMNRNCPVLWHWPEKMTEEREPVPSIEGRIQLVGYEDFARAIDYASRRLRGELS